MKKWFINTLKRLSYRYDGVLLITSIILVIFSYLFQPVNNSKDKYLKGYVSSIAPDLINPVSTGRGRGHFTEVYKLNIIGIEESFYINRYDGEVEKYGTSNIVNKMVTISYYDFYSSRDGENYHYVSSLIVGGHLIYSQKAPVSTNVFWMVLGLTVFSCFMLVWGIWQRLKEEFS